MLAHSLIIHNFSLDFQHNGKKEPTINIITSYYENLVKLKQLLNRLIYCITLQTSDLSDTEEPEGKTWESSMICNNYKSNKS